MPESLFPNAELVPDPAILSLTLAEFFHRVPQFVELEYESLFVDFSFPRIQILTFSFDGD